MKRSILLALLGAAALSAQPQISPLSGTGWEVCQNPATANPFMCNPLYASLPKTYMLNVLQSNPQVAAFHYTVTGVLISTGQTITLTGYVPVQPVAPNGVQPWTAIILYFGGEIYWSPTTIVVDELITSGTGTQQQ